jgi:hypothetical protein
MLGFLVHDIELFPMRLAASACRSLSIYDYRGNEQVGRLAIHFFHSRAPNTYFGADERYVVGISGTLIFDNGRPVEAAGKILRALQDGREPREIFEHCRGPYTLIAADRGNETVSVLSSREGLRQCFSTERNGAMSFGTSLLLLAALTGASPSADGVRHFIHLGTTFGDATVCENIKRVLPASLHAYRRGKWTAARLWRLTPARPDPSVSRDRAIGHMTRSFVRNLEHTRDIPPGRVIADLTGGTDSRIVLYCLMENHPEPVVSTSGPRDFIDVRIAVRLARKLGLEHYRYSSDTAAMTRESIARAVELADGSMCSVSLASQLPYFDDKSRRFDFITGGAGGPLFKDHYWLYEFNRVGMRREPNWDRIAKFSVVTHAIQDDFFTGFQDRVMDSLSRLFRRHSPEAAETNNQKLDFVYFDLKTPAFSGPGFSLTTYFMDVFHPMLDGENVQYSMNLDPRIRIRNILQFGMMQALRPDMRWVLTDNGLPTIPPVGAHAWLRLLRARRYATTAFRKLGNRVSISQANPAGESPITARLKAIGYFDLLQHPSLAFSAIVSPARLASIKGSPGTGSNEAYLVATIGLQLFFNRAAELLAEAKKTIDAPPSAV